ncbi:MAG: hypothetical protein ABI207_02550 [Crocinitomicaceae bacterium]
MRTIQIDDSTSKGKALLEYLFTLDFVKADESDFVLTERHREILNERRENRISGKSKTYSWEEVKNLVENKKLG